MTIHSTSQTVLRLVSKPMVAVYNHVRPTRYQRMRPTKRGHDRLPHLETVVRHPMHEGFCVLSRSLWDDPDGVKHDEPKQTAMAARTITSVVLEQRSAVIG